MTTDDSMSDDVFESDENNLHPARLTTTPSPTGYRDYQPPPDLINPPQPVFEDIAHKVNAKIKLDCLL